jgi:hypothetical protein
MISRLPGGGESPDLQQTPVPYPNEEHLDVHLKVDIYQHLSTFMVQLTKNVHL